MNKDRIVLAALLAVFLGRIVLTYRVFNDTIDEHVHIAAGLEFLERGVYELEAQHPPLARLAVAVLPYRLAGFRRGDDIRLWGPAGTWSHREAPYYWLTLSLARAGNLSFAILLFAFVYWWSLLLFGQRAALVACLLLVCCPSVLGHAGVATVDLAAAATTVMTAFFFWRWSQQGGWIYCLASTVAFGLAALSKFSGLFVLAPIGALYFLTAWWRRGGVEFKALLARGAVFAVLAAVIVWAGYRFDVGALAPAGHRYRSAFQAGHELQGIPRVMARAIETRTLPAPRFWQGLIDVLTHNEHGHRSYLLGEVSDHGWWWYFPVALGLKTTLPLMLLLFGLAWRVWMLRGKAPSGMIYPLLAVLVILAISMVGRINIGVRHVLALYPLFAILASGLWSDALRPRRWTSPAGVLMLILVGWHVGESVVAHPDYLAYFNQVARGREERFLADSNLDWGQDLARLSVYTQQHRIENLQLSYFGVTSPSKLHVPHTAFSFVHPQPGWVAVSVNHLVGIGAEGPYTAWLRRLPPRARVGKTIWLYYLSPSDVARATNSHNVSSTSSN